MKAINIKRFFNNIYFYLLAILAILSDSVMWGIIGGPFPPANVYKYLFYAAVLLSLFFKPKVAKRDLKIIVFASIYFFLYIIIQPVNIKEYFSTFITAIVLIYLLFSLQKGDSNRFFYAFSDLAILTACVSLFFYFFSTVLGLGLGSHTVAYFWADNYRTTETNFYLYFHNPIQDQYLLGRKIFRNVGIFAEAPGYALYLEEALIVELFIKKKINAKRVILLAFTIFTTFSAMGYLMVFLCFAIYFILKMDSYKKRSVKKLVRGSVFFCLALALGIVGFSVAYYRTQAGSASSIRMDDLKIGIHLWFNKPLLGYGYMNYDPLVQRFNVYRDNDGVSMGLSTLLATGGLYLVIPFFLPLICSVFSKSVERKKQIFISLVLLIVLFFSIVYNSILYLMFSIGIVFFSCHPKIDIHKSLVKQ